jgi:two-component system NtrC family sensor kinase
MTNELNTQIHYRLIEKLSESERRYRELVESLREIVFKCDQKGIDRQMLTSW